jgi:para-nitrobenzyl esterase
LSALGFLVHPGLELENEQGVSGNYAVMDQIMALKWVQNNISNFGGENKNVTIFGESAGGINVGNLLTTQLASGLFHKAIIESGGPIINNYNFAKKDGIDFVNKFISDGTDSTKISYMRNLPSDSLIIGENAPFAGGIVQLTWQPVIDGVIFIKSPKDIFQTGNYNKVPIIIGSNADEVAISVPNVITPTMVEKLITDKLPMQYQETALALYPPGNNNEEARNSYIGILTDMPFTTSARRNSQCISLNQTQPVWRYFFTHTQKAPILNKFGSYHGIELF